jgi:hypothetical protein
MWRRAGIQEVHGKENQMMAVGLVDAMLYGGLLMAGLVGLLATAMGILANK